MTMEYDDQSKFYINIINPFISFGKMPIANGFLKKDQFRNEYFFELATAFCDKPKC